MATLHIWYTKKKFKKGNNPKMDKNKNERYAGKYRPKMFRN